MARNKKHFSYAFITFETPEEVEKAVELFHGKEYEGRPLKVEKATHKERIKGPKKPKKKSPKSAEASPKEEGAPQEERPVEKETPTRSSKKTPSIPKPAPEPKENGDSENNGEEQQEGRTDGRRKGRGRGGVRPRRKRTMEKGDPSLTTLYVSNLPFNLSDEGLQQVFSSFDVKSAHVVRHVPSGRSKGFGFIDFDSNEEQQRVLAEIGIVEINGRVLNVSVALSKPFVPSEEKGEPEVSLE